MKKLLTTLLLLLITTCLFASDTTTIRKFYLGISEMPGFGIANLNHLNSRLGANGYSPVSNDCAQIAFAIIMGNVKHKGYQSIEFILTGQAMTDKSDKKTALTTYQFMDNLNLNLWRDRTFLVHPIIGFGFYTGNLTINNKFNATHSFDSAFTSRSTQVKAASGYSYLVNTGVGVNKTLGSRFFIGFEAGYKFQLNQPGWYTTDAYDTDNKITDFPKINMGGFYARVVVNFWLTEIVPFEKKKS